MPTRVFITIDTELMWRHHVAGHDIATIAERSLEPAGVGVGWQLAQLNRHGLKACFFVDPMPALVYGLDPVKRVVERILHAGQEVQLHLHPNWTGARAGDKGASYGLFELIDYGLDGQRALIDQAAELLTQAGAGALTAFRSGSYSANDDTLRALAALGFRYDSSHNGSEHPWPSAIGLPTRQIAPIERNGIIEVPVTCIEDRPGHLRHFQICALSAAEMRAALVHAARERHVAVTIVGHGFELANRAGTRPNAVHVRRFESLCRMLAERRGTLVTTHFRDGPALPLDAQDQLLGPSLLRTRLRQAEQLWSNWVEERAA
ncbi:polysaccharide deacetylase [Sphingomonas xinjiangensis]|uniref:Peptidoglycan/xylan/chitin deacetylase (PgdA/CDA1 family) n=1 Tax=Sphingomonas xinjiangensis TaxID=643568 RepID=A0A840YH62_9SPHN|nr:polysaccharide deacetylase [Sphingomonas xinjiangensis]MBB5710148.1 peptidoglycan/xylan/chitin deacetylase (PgdA/CDA1 family) [Sphingomonas xinjiangensis]